MIKTLLGSLILGSGVIISAFLLGVTAQTSDQPLDYLPGSDFSFASLGTTPDGKTAGDQFTLGQFHSLGLQDFTVAQTLGSQNLTPDDVGLDEYELATSSTLDELVAAVPGLEERLLDDVSPIAKLYDESFALRTVYLESEDRDFTVQTVGDAIYVFNYFGLSKKLSDTDLSEYKISDIPNLGDTKVDRFSDSRDAFLRQIPGLVSTALTNALPLDYFVKMDIPYGMSDPDYEEHGIDNTASGTKDKRSWPCPQEDLCPHIEVWRPSGSPQRLRWISGKKNGGQEWLPAGWGAGKAICSEEPTGRFPFGEEVPAKLVLTDINETEGTAEFAIYFAVEVYGPFGKIGESAHCFGPFPLLPPLSPANEENWILFGLDDNIPLPFKIPVSEIIGGIFGPTGGGGSGPVVSETQAQANAVDCPNGATDYGSPTTGQISSEYGWRWGRLHAGIDIAAAEGTPIYASNCGTVDYVNYQGDFGNVLTIDHGHHGTLYAHLQYAPLANVGQYVKKGQLIGYMGTTGRSTGPHLHFEFHRGGYGNPVDPREVVRF